MPKISLQVILGRKFVQLGLGLLNVSNIGILLRHPSAETFVFSGAGADCV